MRGGGRTVAVLYASVMPSACAAENVTQPSVAGAVHVNVCDRAGMGENQASPCLLYTLTLPTILLV